MSVQPPPYDDKGAPPPQGYPPPQQGYPPPQQGYPPPQQGYPPPQQGYPPPQQGYPHPHAYPPPQAPSAPGVVVVQGAAAPTQTTVVTHVQPRPRVNHVLHLIITLLFWPWVIVWIILCITEGA